MKRIAAGMLTLVLLLSGCAGAATGAVEDERPLVYTSFYPLYDFAGKVGGDCVRVELLVPTGAEPHDWEPSTSDMVKLEEAVLLVYNGAGLEPWMPSILSALEGKGIRFLETSQGLVDETVQPTDPHVWLSPLLACEQMRVIKDTLVALDEPNADIYEENFLYWQEQFEELDREYRAALDPLAGQEIIVAHAAFGYLCREYGLEQVAVQGLSPEDEPSPATMARVVEHLQDSPARVIFFEELASDKVAETIAREVGAETAVLYTVEGLSEEQARAGADYFSLMRANLEALLYALA